MTNTFPQRYPLANFNFAHVQKSDPKISFERDSIATCYAADGTRRTVQNNVPRIDYDPLTGECRGLLIEPKSENLCLGSNYMGPHMGASAGVKFEYTDTYATFTEGLGKGSWWVERSQVLNSDEISVSFDVENITFQETGKDSDMRGLSIGIGDSARVFCDLFTGEVTFGGSDASQAKALRGKVIHNINGVHRVQAVFRVLKFTKGGTLSFSIATLGPKPDLSTTYVGTGVKLKFSNLQIEASLEPTSYIETTPTATATRAADKAYFSTYPSDTLAMRMYVGNVSEERVIASINTDSSETSVDLCVGPKNNLTEIYIRVEGKDDKDGSSGYEVDDTSVTSAMSVTDVGYIFCASDGATTIHNVEGGSFGGIMTFGDVSPSSPVLWLQRVVAYGRSVEVDELQFMTTNV